MATSVIRPSDHDLSSIHPRVDDIGPDGHLHPPQRRLRPLSCRHSHADPRASVGRCGLAGPVRAGPRRLQRRLPLAAPVPGRPAKAQPFRSRVSLLFLHRGLDGPHKQVDSCHVLHYRVPAYARPALSLSSVLIDPLLPRPAVSTQRSTSVQSQGQAARRRLPPIPGNSASSPTSSMHGMPEPRPYDPARSQDS
jgi:hypothetical protein